MSDNINTMTNEHPTPQCKPSQKEQDLLQDLKTDGRKELEEKYPRGINIPDTSILEVFHFDIKVSQVFTPPCLVDGRNQSKSIEYEEILQHFLPKSDQQQHLQQQLQKHHEQEDSRQTAQRRVILIEGVPGFGKTTLSRKIFSDWMSGNSSIKRLHDYDFVILVDSHDDPSLSSLDELLSSHMPTSVENFKKKHPDSTGLHHLQVLIIVDSLEELSERFASQLQEIINDEISENLDFIVFTRPEKVKSFSEMIPTEEFVHMKIEGLHTLEEREGFIKKYIEELRRKKRLFDAEGIQLLLKSTETHLSFLWSNPLFLVLVTLLWAFDPDKVNPNTTPVNVLLEVWKSHITRLKKRLMVNDTINKFDRRDVTLGRNIKKFLFILSKMAFQSLRDNNVQLTKASHETLQQTCQFLNLPENEAIGVFLRLKKDFSVDFIEKSQRDILAALYLYHGMVGGETGANERTVQDLIKTLKQYESSDSITQEIRDIINSFCPVEELLLPECAIRHNTQTKPEATKTFQSIKKILQEMDEKVPEHLSKYQEVLIHLLGFVHDLPPYSIKELVELIKESGAEDDIPKWVEVITKVKYDDTVASKIAEEANIESYMITILDNGHNCDFLLAKFKHKSSESYQEMILDDENIRGLFALFKQKRPLCADICIEKETGKVAMLESLLPRMIDVKMSVNSLYLKDESEKLRRAGDPNTPNPNIKKVLQRMTPEGCKKLIQLLDLDETFVQHLHGYELKADASAVHRLQMRDVHVTQIGQLKRTISELERLTKFFEEETELKADASAVHRQQMLNVYMTQIGQLKRTISELERLTKFFEEETEPKGQSSVMHYPPDPDVGVAQTMPKIKRLKLDSEDVFQKKTQQMEVLSSRDVNPIKEKLDLGENIHSLTRIRAVAPPVYAVQEEDFLFMKGLKSVIAVGGKSFLLAFEWISGKDPRQSFKDYFMTKTKFNSTMKLKQIFRNTHRMELDLDSSDKDKTFDITFLYICFRYGCQKCPSLSGDDGWVEGDESSLKSNITKIKNTRNYLVHMEGKFSSEAELEAFLQGVQKHLELILRQSAAIAGIGQTEVDQRVKEMKESIENIKGFSLTMDDIELAHTRISQFRDDLRVILSKEGGKELKQKYKNISYIDPGLSFYRKKPVKMSAVFMAMETKRIEENQLIQGKPIYSAEDYRDMLMLMTDSDERPWIIIVEGDAGVGKSTLLKQLVAEWDGDDLPHGSSPTIKGIQDYDLTIKGIQDYDLILHHDFRKKIGSFESLLSALLPQTSRKMREKDLLHSILNVNVLIAFDGLDETIEESHKLLKQVIDEILPRSNGKMQMLITTRPHKVKDILRLCRYQPKLHLKLTGIKPEKRIEFVQKLHKELIDGDQSTEETDPLVDHVIRLQAQIGEHLSLPLNLTLITYLWAFDSKRVQSITTVTGLYLQLQELAKSNLIKRLKDCDPKYFGIDDKDLMDKCDEFLKLLFEKSFDSHAHGFVQFPEEYCKELRKKCQDLHLPYYETCAAFLTVKREQTEDGEELYLEYPHKSMLEKDASQFILNQLCQMKEEKTVSIADILKKKLGDPITKEKLEHLQNALIFLVGILYEKEMELSLEHAEDLCRILSESGIKPQKSRRGNLCKLNKKWFKMATETKCNHRFVQSIAANAEKEGISVMGIRDGQCNPALAILKSQNALPSLEEIDLSLSSDGSLIPELETLLEEVSNRDCKVRLHLHHHWRNLQDGSNLIQHLLTENRRCRVIDLQIHLENPSLVPPEARDICLGLSPKNGKNIMEEIGKHERDHIGIHVSISQYPESLRPLPQPRNGESTSLFVSDVGDTDADKVIKIAEKLQPGNRKYSVIRFPKRPLTSSGAKRLIQDMRQKGIMMEGGGLHVSSSYITTQEEEELKFYSRRYVNSGFVLEDDESAWGPELLGVDE